MPDSLNAKDLEGRFIAANPETARLMNAPDAASLIGKTDFEFYPPQVARQFHQDEQLFFADPRSRLFDQRLDREDGSHIWLSTQKSPLIDRHGETGRRDHSQTATSTSLKKLEHELIEAQQMLSDAMENMANGFALYDQDDRMVFCNEQYRKPVSSNGRVSRSRRQSPGHRSYVAAIG